MLLHKSVLHDTRVRREAEALHEAGHDVTVVELASVEYELLHVRRVSALPPRWLRRWRPAKRLAAAFLLVRRAVRQRPDVVHAHDAAMLLPGFVAARLTGAQLVYDTHEYATGVPYRERRWHWFVEMTERALMPRCAAVITVSEGIADRLHLKYRLRRRPAVVRNVSSLRVGTASVGLRERLRIGDAPLVIHQGAAAAHRGCEVLLKAVAGLPGVHLCFLGGGERPVLARLALLAERLGVAGRIHFLPRVPPEQLLSLTADADVGVSLLQDTCDNHRLALPNKLFEYLAAGVPVVVSDLPEMSRLVSDHGVGWCARSDDPAAVAGALEEALVRRADADLRRRVAAAGSQLSWTNERGLLNELYATLVA